MIFIQFIAGIIAIFFLMVWTVILLRVIVDLWLYGESDLRLYRQKKNRKREITRIWVKGGEIHFK